MENFENKEFSVHYEYIIIICASRSATLAVGEFELAIRGNLEAIAVTVLLL